MNSLNDIQGKLNNGYILTYLSDDFYNSLKGSPLSKSIHKYDMLDFMSFDPRESNYITGIISSDSKLLDMENYSLALFPISEYIDFYINDNQSVDLFAEIDFIKSLFSKTNEPTEVIDNIYNYIFDKFLNYENIEAISLNELIENYNEDNKVSVVKPLLLTNSNNIMKLLVVKNFLKTIISLINKNGEIKEEDASVISDVLLYVMAYISENGREVLRNEYEKEINYLLETFFIIISLNVLNIADTDDNIDNILSLIDNTVEMMDKYSIYRNEEDRLNDNRYIKLANNIEKYFNMLYVVKGFQK